jgi:hypothetical protein
MYDTTTDIPSFIIDNPHLLLIDSPIDRIQMLVHGKMTSDMVRSSLHFMVHLIIPLYQDMLIIGAGTFTFAKKDNEAEGQWGRHLYSTTHCACNKMLVRWLMV